MNSKVTTVKPDDLFWERDITVAITNRIERNRAPLMSKIRWNLFDSCHLAAPRLYFHLVRRITLFSILIESTMNNSSQPEIFTATYLYTCKRFVSPFVPADRFNARVNVSLNVRDRRSAKKEEKRMWRKLSARTEVRYAAFIEADGYVGLEVNMRIKVFDRSSFRIEYSVQNGGINCMSTCT